MKLTKELALLRSVYFGAFLCGVLLVILMHTFDRPALDIFRVPTFIGTTSAFNGLAYFPTFKIYQVSLVTSLLVVLVDGLCLTSFRSKVLTMLSEITTIIGLTILLLAVFFFSYNFLLVNHSLRGTALVYIAFSIFLIVIDLLNFQADEKLLKKESKNV